MTAGWPSDHRLEFAFNPFTDDEIDHLYGDLEAECAEHRERQRCGEEIEWHRQPRVGSRFPLVRNGKEGNVIPLRRSRDSCASAQDALDPVHGIEPRLYVEVLTGVDVPRSGMICCPLHEDRWPSFKVYDEPDRGWYCFGCHRGGDAYNLGGELWGLDSRRDFHELRRRLIGELLRRAA